MKNESAANISQPKHILKNEVLFKALIQNSTDIFIISNHNFKFIYVSDAIIKILGYFPDELVGRSGFELIHPDEKESFAVWLAQMLENPSTVISTEVRFKNSIGSWIYLEVQAQNIMSDDQEPVLVINCRDIQAKKIADQALMLAEQRLTLLLNNTKESFIILNSKLRVIAYNKAAQEHSPFFFKTELQSGFFFHDLIKDDDEKTYLNLLQKTVGGNEQQIDTSYTDETGALHIYRHVFRPLHLGNEGQGVFVTSTDITDKYYAELALKENEEKFKTIIEYSFDAVLIIDKAAIIKYASPSITNLLGYEPEELIGKNGFDFIHEEDIPEVQAKLTSVINDVEESYADYRSKTKHDDYKWVEAKGKNMFNNKHINGILVSLRDISQRKKMIEEQTALTNELIKYNKDLQQFSFITSHNLRAPVANLLGLLTLYNREELADPLNAELLSKFDECTQQLNQTLSDLINILVIRTKPNADLEYISFDEIAEQVRKNVQALLQEIDGELITDFSQVEGIEYNRLHMESIFLNLISNSIKYSSPEKRLKIRVTAEKTDAGVKVIFSDNGIGIDLNRYGDRMFGLYQRFHSGKQGKGLGLYMVKSQVLASGGSIKVESEPGVGTAFIVHFKN